MPFASGLGVSRWPANGWPAPGSRVLSWVRRAARAQSMLCFSRLGRGWLWPGQSQRGGAVRWPSPCLPYRIQYNLLNTQRKPQALMLPLGVPAAGLGARPALQPPHLCGPSGHLESTWGAPPPWSPHSAHHPFPRTRQHATRPESPAVSPSPSRLVSRPAPALTGCRVISQHSGSASARRPLEPHGTAAEHGRVSCAVSELREWFQGHLVLIRHADPTPTQSP